MSGKNQFYTVFNWQASSPVTGFLPANISGGSLPSGTVTGAMASTNTIYSQIIDVAKMDNIGLEITFTGTPTGVLSVQASNSGITFYPLTFSPALTQPAGGAGGYVVNLNQYPYKYIYLQYVNATGTGVLTAYAQLKDLN